MRFFFFAVVVRLVYLYTAACLSASVVLKRNFCLKRDLAFFERNKNWCPSIETVLFLSNWSIWLFRTTSQHHYHRSRHKHRLFKIVMWIGPSKYSVCRNLMPVSNLMNIIDLLLDDTPTILQSQEELIPKRHTQWVVEQWVDNQCPSVWESYTNIRKQQLPALFIGECHFFSNHFWWSVCLSVCLYCWMIHQTSEERLYFPLRGLGGELPDAQCN